MPETTPSPSNASLSLLFDNRTGQTLEIVVPVLNEEKRIKAFLAFYSGYDLVFLDGGSTDATLDLLFREGATVFRRTGQDFVGENHFVHYANHLSKSHVSFYMMIDEFISLSDLSRVHQHLLHTGCGVGVIKIEYLFGFPLSLSDLAKSSKPHLGMPRGIRSGDALYDPSNLHNSLLFSESLLGNADIINVRLDHLHPKVLRCEYGKIGAYIDCEVPHVLAKPRPFAAFLRRFAIPPAKFMLIDFWLIKSPFHVRLYRALELCAYFILSLMALIEKSKKITFESQQIMYSSRFGRNF